MTREEAAQLKVGEEVLVRMAVVDRAQGPDGNITAQAERGYVIWVSPAEIHSLAPPRPLTAGDWAMWGGRREDPHQVLCTHESVAWTINSNGNRMTIPLSHLIRCEAPK